MTRTVRGASVLITGAASSMGLLYAERAVTEGARDVVLWDADQRGLTATVARVKRRTTRATSIHPDVVNLADAGAIAQAAQRVRKNVGGIDVLINNATISRRSFFWQHDAGDDIRPVMQVNALAPLYVTREFLPGMMEGARATSARGPRAARIVNIASPAGFSPVPGMSVYAASKWAVVGWSESLRIELQQQGNRHVRVTTVMPGYIDAGSGRAAETTLTAPRLRPEYVLDRVWAAMLEGRPSLSLPRRMSLGSVVRGLLPSAVREALDDLRPDALAGSGAPATASGTSGADGTVPLWTDAPAV